MGASHLPSFNSSHRAHGSPQLKLRNPDELSSQIRLHALLLWASVGLLMPAGVIIIRMSTRAQSVRRLKVLFYAHVIVQVMAILMVTAAAVLSVMKFENSFSNTHQRVGLALYALIWIQPLIAFFRPPRGKKTRSIWYLGHWVLGIGVCVLGMANIYLGLHGYNMRTSARVGLLRVAFTMEVCVLAFFFLFQDRWDHMVRQGAILDGQVAPTSTGTSPSPSNSRKELRLLMSLESDQEH